LTTHVLDPGPSVEAALPQAIERQRRLGDFDDQQRVRGMPSEIIPRLASHDDNVRLGFR